LKSKCVTCKFGAYGNEEYVNIFNVIYKFNLVTKTKDNKIITINYSEGDVGCCRVKWNNKEDICLFSGNFSEYEKFNESKNTQKISATFTEIK